jgi:hypothetical protein
MRQYSWQALSWIIVSVACSSSTPSTPSRPSPAPPVFTQSDANVLASMLSTNAFNAASAGQSSAQRVGAKGTSGVTCNGNGPCQLSVVWSATEPCPAGGHESSSGRLSGSVSLEGGGPVGNVALQQNSSLADCAIDSSSVYSGMSNDAGSWSFTSSGGSFDFSEASSLTVIRGSSGVSSVSAQLRVVGEIPVGGTFSGTVTAAPGGTYSVSGRF